MVTCSNVTYGEDELWYYGPETLYNKAIDKKETSSSIFIMAFNNNGKHSTFTNRIFSSLKYKSFSIFNIKRESEYQRAIIKVSIRRKCKIKHICFGSVKYKAIYKRG